MEMLAGSSAYNIFLFKTIIMFGLAACLVITSEHDSHVSTAFYPLWRKQLRSRG